MKKLNYGYKSEDGLKKGWYKASYKALETHPEKWKARAEVRKALARGDIHRPDTCELKHLVGGCVGRLEAHHYDYSKPLEVVWLCRKHHRQAEVSTKAA